MTAVVSPALRWGTIGGAVAICLGIVSLRMCGDVSLPPKPPAPTMNGSAQDVLKNASATHASWRARIERDAATVGVPAPGDDAIAKKLLYRVDEEARVIAPGEGSVEAAGLRLTASTEQEEGRPRQALVLTIENLTDSDLAYHVVSTPRPGGAACNDRLLLAHNAIVVAKGGKVIRSECIYRSGMSLAIEKVETIALPPLSSAYVSRLPPAAVGADARLSRGHRPDLPGGMGVCTTVASQSVRADIQSGATTWRDLVDYYARHSCDNYQFPEGYRAFERDGAQALPVGP
jgi:hypothetical protein